MKRFACAVAVLGLIISSSAFAAATPFTLKGYIIDNACAAANEKTLGKFVLDHPKTCVLKKSCAASGFSIYSEGKLRHFDKHSYARIRRFLEKKNSRLKVTVRVKEEHDRLVLLSIKDQ